MQLNRNLEELNEYRRKLDLNARDNKRLQNDLLIFTHENQVRRNFFKSYIYMIISYSGVSNINKSIKQEITNNTFFSLYPYFSVKFTLDNFNIDIETKKNRR